MNARKSSALRGGLRVATVATAMLFAIVSGLPVGATSAKPQLSGVVNINTASAEELQLLPGVGDTRAAAILESRASQGSFKSVDALLDVKGIGPTMLERMRPHVVLTGRTTAQLEPASSKAEAAASSGSK
jgi:comEA protein